MKRRVALVAVLALTGATAGVVRAGSLDAEIQKVLDQKLMKGKEFGVQVVRLGAAPSDVRVVYARNAGVARMPASNLKLVTTAAALARLGTDFKFRTKLVLRGNDVILVGDGDPSLGDSELLEGTGWGTTTVFKSWAAELKKRGITSVGNVVVDDSVFDGEFHHPKWSKDQYMQPHSAEVGGVSLNANLVNVTVRGKGSPASVSFDPVSRGMGVKNTMQVGGETRVAITREREDSTIIVRGSIKSGGVGVYKCTVHDPGMFAGGALAQVLADEGIAVGGKVVRERGAGQAAAAGTVVGVFETPVTTVVSHANKVSQNLYAEALCKRMGRAMTGQPGSWENGTAAVGEYLKKLGIGESEYKLSDGCGLSRGNQISPNAVCRVLAANFYSENRELFIKSMAVGGVDGTLKNRFEERDIKGKVFAKTGFIEGVTGLSGYLQGKGGEWYAFSILINGIGPKSNSIYKEYQERIVRAVYAAS